MYLMRGDLRKLFIFENQKGINKKMTNSLKLYKNISTYNSIGRKNDKHPQRIRNSHIY